MSVEIREAGVNSLPLYATISPAFRVDSILRVELIDKGLAGFRLIEEKVTPYVKYEDAKEALGWPDHHDISNWGIFIAFDGDRPVGGAAVADTPAGMTTPFEKEDIAALWDLRVHPDHRRCGVGTNLLIYAADWAR